MNIEYVTQQNDRWDLIAYKAYGTVGNILLNDGSQANAMSYLIQNNQDIAVNDMLDAGLLLQIPIINSTILPTDPTLLPPWKR